MENKMQKRPPLILINMAVGEYLERETDFLISSYAQRVSDAGGVPLLIPSIEKEEIISTLLDLADGVLLIGGKDYDPRFFGEPLHPRTNLDRKRPHFDIAFGKAVLQRDVPVLGICAGCQLINSLCGGRLIQHLDDAELHVGGTTHEASVDEEGWFSRSLGRKAGEVLTVNSFHHQAVDPAGLGQGLRITARAFDGSVEAIEGTGSRMLLGVQFHPERMDDVAPGVFGTLLAEAARRKAR